jgi:hypothetical protein
MLSTQGAATNAGVMGKIIRTPDSLRQSEDLFNGEMPDGIYFRKDGKPESDGWKFNFLKFQANIEFEHSAELDFDKWLVVLFEDYPDDEVRVHYAFVRNHVKAKVQGFVVKKSIPGYGILIQMMEQMQMDEVHRALVLEFADYKKD